MTDLTNSEKLKDELNNLNLNQLSSIARDVLSVIYNKLRDEGFGYSINITGTLDNDYPDIYLLDSTNLSNGSTDYRDCFRL